MGLIKWWGGWVGGCGYVWVRVRVRMRIQALGTITGLWDCVRVRVPGPSSLPHSLPHSLTQVLFFAKDNADRVLWGKTIGDGKELAAYQSFLSGAVAGGAGPLVSAPMDIVKTRLQSATAPKYPNVLVAVGRIAREEGVTGWYIHTHLSHLKSFHCFVQFFGAAYYPESSDWRWDRQ